MSIGQNYIANQVVGEKFRILKQLGEGGMGAVYLGEHLHIGKKVAIKILHSQYISDEIKVKRFFREARVSAAVEHRNIIDVFDVGVSDKGDPYMVMEYLEGESLSSLLARRGPFDLRTVCSLILPSLDALSAAHDAGVVHRDLKPDNIFLIPSRKGVPEVKIIDFGVSKFIERGSERLTLPGFVVGTPSYMSPEQAGGEGGLDERSDVFSIGVIYFELLTGRLPFDGDSNNRIIYNILYGEPTPLGELRPELSDEAVAVVMKALAKVPEDRYQSVAEFVEALRNVDGCTVCEDRLREIGEDLTNISVASGCLGANPAIRQRVRRTPTGLTVPEGVEYEAPPQPSAFVRFAEKILQRRSAWYGMIAVLLILGCVGAFVYQSAIRPEASDRIWTVKYNIEQRQYAGEVHIFVEGIPDNAEIFQGDVRLEGNPFVMPRTFDMLSFRVEAKGYQSARFAVVPSEDRTVMISLQPLP